MVHVARIVLLLLLLSTTTHAATYYAAPGGSGSCQTNRDSPGALIPSINCLKAGDTLYLLGGTYTDHLSTARGVAFPSGSSWADAPTIAAAPGATVVIQTPDNGDGGAMLQIGGPSGSDIHHLVFDNIVFDAAKFGKSGSNNAVKLDQGSHHIRFRKGAFKNARGLTNPSATKGVLTEHTSCCNEFLGVEITGNLGYGLYLPSPRNLVDGCHIHDNNRYGVHIYDDGGGVDGNIVRNSRIEANGDNSAGCWGGCYHPGLLLSSGNGNTAYNNLIVGNGNGGVQIGGTGTLVYNNTIYGNQREAGIFGDADGTQVRNNIVYQNNGAIRVGGSGVVQSNNLTGADPKFVNPNAGDFHLQPGSPAIKAGVDMSQVYTTDMEGTRRAAGAYDLGALAVGGTGGGGGTPTALAPPRNLRLLSTPSQAAP